MEKAQPDNKDAEEACSYSVFQSVKRVFNKRNMTKRRRVPTLTALYPGVMTV